MIIIIIICRCLITNAYPSTAHHVNKSVLVFVLYAHVHTNMYIVHTCAEYMYMTTYVHNNSLCTHVQRMCVVCAYTVTIRGVLKNTKHKNLQEREKYQRNTF